MCSEVSEGENTFQRRLVTWLVFNSYLSSHIASAMPTPFLRLLWAGAAPSTFIFVYSLMSSSVSPSNELILGLPLILSPFIVGDAT